MAPNESIERGEMVSPHFVTVTFTAAIALTAIGWGFGYLVGKWIAWWWQRRKVIKWLRAEGEWKRELCARWLAAELIWKHEQWGCDTCRSEYRRRNTEYRRHTPGCRPGMECWQGCDNCRPPPGEEILAFQRSDMMPIRGNGETTIYRQLTDGMGLYRFSEYRAGVFIRSWISHG